MLRHAVAQCMALGQGEVTHQVPRSVQRSVVVQQPDPERRQRTQAAPRTTIGAAHFQVLLQAHFRERGGHVVRPVAQRRQRARQHRQPGLHEIAEALPAGVVVDAIAVGEIHRHVEQVIDIALVTEAILKHEVEHAGAVSVGVGPDVRAVAQVAVGLAFGERRIGEQRGGDRLQRQRYAELLHHVRFGRVVQVHLYRAGAGHHVQAERTDLGHVRTHDLVATLGHPGHLVALPLRLEAHAEETQLQFAGHLRHFVEVGAGLHAGLVDGLQRRTGQLQLTGRFQRHRGAIAQQGDRVAVLLHRLPAEADQAVEQRFDAALAFEGRRAQVIQAEPELLVLGADAPLRAGLLAGGDHLHQLRAVGNGGIGDVAGARQGKGSLDGGGGCGARGLPSQGRTIAWHPVASCDGDGFQHPTDALLTLVHSEP